MAPFWLIKQLPMSVNIVYLLELRAQTCIINVIYLFSLGTVIPLLVVKRETNIRIIFYDFRVDSLCIPFKRNISRRLDADDFTCEHKG